MTKDLKKTLYFRCELFTSKEYAYMSAGQMVKKGGPNLWEDESAFHAYADSLLPVACDDFFAEAAAVLQPRHHRMLRRLLDFRFDRRATRYNLPTNRLTMIEQEVRRRASWLLQEKQ